MDFDLFDKEVEELVDEVASGILKPEEFDELFRIQQRRDARRAKYDSRGDSDYTPEVESLGFFSENRPSNTTIAIRESIIDEAADILSLQRHPEDDFNIDGDFYKRALKTPNKGFMMDDNIFHDLFNDPKRSIDTKIDRNVWGCFHEHFENPERFNPELNHNGKVRINENFNRDDILGFLDSAVSEGYQLAYASGLEERLSNYWDREVVEIFMDMVNRIADPVESKPVGSSEYPVDAGISEAATNHDLDVVTYDRDFLETDDEIWNESQEVYTPQQAYEMML